MVKLKLISTHKIKDIPDHVLQTIAEFTLRLSKHTMPLIDSVDPNIALAGINWLLPLVIKHLVTNNPEELNKAVFYSCEMLGQNMEILIKEMEKENDKINLEERLNGKK